MKEELIDVLDENGLKTGEIVKRSEVHKKGLWHRSIIVAIVNEKNEILIQKRSKYKDKNAGLWDLSVAGHISSGQDSVSAANREISEEVSVKLGYNVEVKEFRFMYSFRKEQKFSEDFIERQFYDFFILRQANLNNQNIKMQESEVEEIDFVSYDRIKELIAQNLFVDRKECFTGLADYIYRL